MSRINKDRICTNVGISILNPILACSTEVHFRVTHLQQRGINQIELEVQPTKNVNHQNGALKILSEHITT